MRLKFITRNTPLLLRRRTPYAPIPSHAWWNPWSYNNIVHNFICNIYYRKLAKHKHCIIIIGKMSIFNRWYSRLIKALKWRVELKLIQIITITKSYLKEITISNFHSAHSWYLCLVAASLFLRPSKLNGCRCHVDYGFFKWHPRSKPKL